MGRFMSSEEMRGVVVNAKTISAAVGVLTLLAALVAGVTHVNHLGFRTTQIEKEVSGLRIEMRESDRETRENYEKILQKFDALTTEVTKLTIALGNVQYKQDIGPQKQ